jgi:hypothetical protein
MANATDQNIQMGNGTTVMGTGDLMASAAKDRAAFIRAVTAGLEDLDAGRELSFDDAANRLGLERGEGSS